MARRRWDHAELGRPLEVRPAAAVKALPLAARDDRPNHGPAFVEVSAGARSYGVWLVSNALRPTQSFVHEGRA